MTRTELHQLVDRIPEIAFDGATPRPVVASLEDIGALTRSIIELAERAGELTHEWMERFNRDLLT